MAAPFFAYTNKELNIGSSKHYIAKLDTSYNTMKSRFYLDDFVNVDGVGVIGCVAIGGANEAMHNIATRGGVGRIGNMRMLNDAGLNTYGNAIVGAFLYKWANNIGVNSEFLASWYSDSTNLGIRYKKTSSSSWVTLMFNELLLKQTSVNSLRHITPTFDPFDSVDIQLININEEGTYYSPTTVINVGDNVWSYGVLKRTTPCSTSGQIGEIIWIKQDEYANLPSVTTADANTGIFLYTDVTMTTKYGAGWYFGLDGQKSFEVNSNGEIRKYELCTASLPTVTLNYEMDISGWYRFNVSLSSSYSSNVTVTFRIDTSNTITAKAKYVSITVTAGNTHANEPIWRDLSDDTYHIYDAVVSPAILTLVVAPL